MVTQEEATAIATLLGAASAVVVVLWRVFKVSRVFLREQECIKKSIETIKNEVTPNSGESLKDVVNLLKSSCDRIEIRQKVLDQRSKASLHYSDHPLFETDKKGRAIWSNEAFQNLIKENGDWSEGYDWIAVIDEGDREEFLKEFQSCIDMCRKVDIETTSVNGNKIHFVGFPYTIEEGIHEGFLIRLHKHKEN
jgi:hypothetical protein